MEKEQITISVSIPTRELVDVLETMAVMNNRKRSQMVVDLIRAEAEKLGLITRRLNGAAQK
jgi:hypothetical protein